MCFFCFVFLVVVELLVGKHTFFNFFFRRLYDDFEIIHSTFSFLDEPLRGENYQTFVWRFFRQFKSFGSFPFQSAFRVLVHAHIVNFLLYIYALNRSETNHDHYVLLIFLLPGISTLAG